MISPPVYLFPSCTNIHSYTQKNDGLVGRDVDRARMVVKKIQGMVVEMPLHFLEEEKPIPKFWTKEYFMPQIVIQRRSLMEGNETL